MQTLYDWLVDVIAWIMCWAISTAADIAAAMPVFPADFEATVGASIAYVAIFLDPDVVPVHLTLSLAAFLGSIVVIWLMRMIILLWRMLPLA